MKGPEPARRLLRLIRVVAVGSLIAGLVALIGTRAGAANIAGTGLFQLDGNATQDGSPPPDDWATLYADCSTPPTTCAPNGGAFAFSGIHADPPATDTTYFTGGGSKDPNPISQWANNANGAPAKDEITDDYAAAYRTPITNHLVVFFGADRYANNGDSQIGFWFFANPVSVNADGGFTGVHTAPNAATGTHGDLLVLSDFTQGGAIGNMKVYEWVGSGGSAGAINLIYPLVGTPTVDCQSLALTPTVFAPVCATVNEAGPTPSPWPYVPKMGTPNVFPTGSFFEGGIDVSALFPGGNPCFASFLGETRSSQSPTATLEDFDLGGFEHCTGSTSLALASYAINGATAQTPPANNALTVHKGDSLVLTFAETNTGNIPLAKPDIPSYVVVDPAESSACAPAEVQSGGFNVGDNGGTAGVGTQNGKLDPTETWKYSCTVNVGSTTPTTIVAYGHGIDTLSSAPANKDVTYCDTTTPSNNPPLAYNSSPTTATCTPAEITTVNLTVLAPSTILRAQVAATYTFYETNDGNARLTAPDSPLALADLSTHAGAGGCTSFAPVLSGGFNVGDNGGSLPYPTVAANAHNGFLDPGETFQFTCTVSIGAANNVDTGQPGVSSSSAASHTATVTGHGIDTSNSTDVTFCPSGSPPAYEPGATLSGSATTAKCDPDEQRTVMISIG